MTTCAACGHPRAGHLADSCRFGGCGCTGFRDGQARPARTGPRRVSLEIPEGYILTVQLAPIAGLEHDPDAAIEAMAGIEDTRAEVPS